MQIIATLLIILASLTQAIAADDFPSKPITLIVPYGSGGTDLEYRKLAELARKELGQPIIVVNKPGGAGTAAVSQMAKMARPDGYTIAASTAPLLRQPHMMKVDYAPLQDLTWIVGVGAFTFVVMVRDDSPFKTLPDMIAWAKANPGRLSYGSPGAASSQYTAMASLSKAAGIDTLHIAYKGGDEINNALLGGHIMVGANTLAAVPAAPGARLRALAIFDAQRLARMPDLPTVREYGFDVVLDSPYGIVGPKGMSPAVVAKLQDAFRNALHHPENLKLLDMLQQKVWYRSSEAYTQWASRAFEDEGAMVKRIGLRVE